MKKNDVGKLGIMTTVTAVGCASCGMNENTEKPLNVIYIMTDDHSFQTISAYDTRYIDTPNLDRIAGEGMLFRNAYVANSLSGPSRACLLTGKHSHANGFVDNSCSFDGSQQTFPKLLRQQGYQTAVIGKWHLVSDPTGFDYWNILQGQGIYYNPDFNEMGEMRKYDGYATEITTDIALDWIDNKRDKHKLFCLLLHHKAPHRTWMPNLNDLGEFDELTFELPETFWDDYAGRKGAAYQKMNIRRDMNVIYDLKMADKERMIKTSQPGLDWAGRHMTDSMTDGQREVWDAYYTPLINDFKSRSMTDEELAEWKFQRYMKDYLCCIRSLDDNVGRIYSYLEENGILDNTVIIYTSDQGFYMGEHGWFDKRFMYEESFRTPLMIRMPGGVRGETSLFVQNIDNAPTILEMMGVGVPEDMHGESMVPILKGENPTDWRTSLYYHFYENGDDHSVSKHYGVKTERYKLIRFYDPVDTWEMYDFQNDVREMVNVYDDPDHASAREEMYTELKRLQIKYNDPIDR